MFKTFITLIVVAASLIPGLVQADSHRMETTPTAWWWYYGQSHEDIVNIIDETDSRVIDIEVQSTDPLRFSAAFVHNSGVYAESWWWLFDQTPDDIATFLDRNEARLIDIERYETADGPRYAVVMVDNSGADSKAWWWYVGGDALFLEGIIEEHNARLVDIEAYQDGGTRYAVIMIENTGEDAMDWWWYYNVPATTIWNNIAAHGSRLLEYEIRDPEAGTFDAILIPHQETDNINWWWYYGVTQSQLNAHLSQNGARLTDLDTYMVGGIRRYSVVMVNNSNELTTKMGELLGFGSDGSTGVYLQEVGGPTLASLQPTFVYEPSSSLKVTHHLYAMRQVMDGLDDLTSELTVAKGISGLSCPNDGPPFIVQTLEQTLAGMMQNSDNTDTKAMELRYGRAEINTMSSSVVGMANTSINHVFGCDEPPLNEMTLLDAALLYESVAQGLLMDPITREVFYLLMQNENTDSPWWFTVRMENLVHEVAADMGIPGTAAEYWDNIRLAWKPGGDTFLWNGHTEYRSISGWVSLPWNCGGPDIQNKEYVFGMFIHEASDGDYADDRLGIAAELFREQIAEGLESCASPVGDYPGPAATRMLKPTVPNPFNPRTMVKFTVDHPQHVAIAVFDMAGRCVTVLAEGQYATGEHEIAWDGLNAAGQAVSSGTYLVRLKTTGKSESQKIMLLR